MRLFGIVGAGGFGREVMPLAETMLRTRFPNGDFKLVFVEEFTPSITNLNRYPVLSMDEFFAHASADKFFNVTIANYAHRKKMAERMIERGAKSFRIDAFNSMDLANNRIDEGAIFCGFTTITANALIGKFFHANIYSYIAHDCVIGDYVTFAPNVQCNGNVIIEDDVYVGTGVIIRQGTPDKPIIIGKGAVLGMGAVITKSVAPFETVVGNPARPLQVKQTV